MAYVLGFFAADGCMFVNPRGSRYIDFTSTDYKLIYKIREMIGSNHSVGRHSDQNPNWKTRYRLQAGSKIIFNDLLKLGFCPRKAKVLRFPGVPKLHFRHFVRGYFDGDGCVSSGIYNRKGRKDKARVLATRFSSASKQFLMDLLLALREHARLEGGFIVKKVRGFELVFSINDSKKLYRFMYENVLSERFLERKYNKFQKAFKIVGA